MELDFELQPHGGMFTDKKTTISSCLMTHTVYLLLMFRFVELDALLVPEVRGELLYMLSPLQQNMNIHDVHDKYKLTNVIAGVGGCNFSFGQKPRGIPAGRTNIHFINRKGA